MRYLFKLKGYNESVVLYHQLKEGASQPIEKQSSNVALFPIKNKFGKLIAILQLGQLTTKQISIDQEYLILLFCLNLRKIIIHISELQAYKTQLNQQDKWFDFFNELCKQETIFDFSQCLKLWAKQLFSVQQTKVLFEVENQFIYFKENGEQQSQDKTQGIAGLVIKNKNPMLFKDPRSSTEFNRNIDIDSFMPLYCFPLRGNKQQIVGVVEIILKQKSRPLMEINNIFETYPFPSQYDLTTKIEIQVYRFNKIATEAYEYVQKKIQAKQ